jgi:hypothetical protein
LVFIFYLDYAYREKAMQALVFGCYQLCQKAKDKKLKRKGGGCFWLRN